MSEAICPDCGERNARGTEFCGSCGAFLAWDEPETAAPAGPPAADPPVPLRMVASPAPPSVAVGRPPTAAPPPPPTAVPLNPPTAALPHPPSSAPLSSPPGGSRRTWYQPPAAEPAPATPTAVAGPPEPPLPAAPPPQPSPQPPASDVACPRCAVANEPGRRFCRKCGLALVAPRLHDAGPGGPPPAPERLPWWRRILRPAPNTRRAARAAYRQSLPVRYRVLRWALGLLGVGALIGGLSLIGQNPVGWAVDRWNDLRGTTVPVSGLQAHTEPLSDVDAAPLLSDNLADTVWSVPWTASSAQDPIRAACRNPAEPTGQGVPESVVLSLPETVTLTHLSVAAGLPKADARRAQQYLPKTLQLAFTDGTCQRVELADVDGLQQLSIDKVATRAVRIWVVDAFPPASDQPADTVSIAEIRLFQRP